MKTIAFLVFFTCTFTVISQDYHQWSEQFGARASLLGGAAAAGLGDNGTVYYNPAATMFVKHPTMSISVNAYRVRRLFLTNALGDGIDLKHAQFNTMPNLIAGIIELPKHEKVRIGYAVINRKKYSSKFDYLHEAEYEIFDHTAGLEQFVSSYNYLHNINEYWGGFSVSYQLSRIWAIGFSHFGIYRDVKYSNTYSSTVLPTDGSTGDISNVSSTITFDYFNIKGIFKPSIALSLENFKFGITLTTPSFNMFGKGNVYRDFSVINVDSLINTDITFIDRATNVKTQHKEFGSLAIGVSWKLGKKSWLHFTNETFFGGKYYLLFNPDQRPNVYPTSIADSSIYKFFGDQNFLAYGEEQEARTNIGIGFETVLSKHWELYLGARTDFNVNERPYYDYSRIGIDASKWNIYHFSLGGVHHSKKSEKVYTVGIEVGWVPKTEYYHVIDFTTPSIDNALIGNGGRGAYAQQYSVKLILEIKLGKKKKDQ